MTKISLIKTISEKYACNEKLAESIVNDLERRECESQIVYEDEYIAEFRDLCSLSMLTPSGGAQTLRLCICSLAVKDSSCGGDEYLSFDRIDYKIISF